MSEQPNVIFFTWHDAGDWFGCYGHETVHTPGVDRLAAEGARFAQNYSACAICSPSRAAIMTGLFCQHNGVMTLTNNVFMNRIHPHVPHVASRFKDLGYRTALFGIQHEAAHEHVHEVMRFDEQYATDPWANADIIAHYAKQWVAKQADASQPFYMQVGTIDAHLNRFYSDQPPRDDEAYPPVQDTEHGLAQPAFLEDTEASRETVATLQGQLRRGDRLVGAILDALDDAGLAENTLVVMCVDHGPGLTRAKTTCYDPGIKTAWVMRMPGIIPPGTVVESMVTHVDVLPTLWDLLGLDPIAGLDGISVADQACGGTQTDVHDAVFSHMVENTRGMRTRQWKLIRNFRPPPHVGMKGDCADQHRGYPLERPRIGMDAPTVDRPLVELYDLEADPHEMCNLSEDPVHRAVRDELNAKMWDFLLDTDDFIVHDPVRTAWQLATRREMGAHCSATGRLAPVAKGPLANAIDAASEAGTVV